MSVNTQVPTRVYLVGAGPGHPGLLTKRAERCIRRADIILFDRLVHPFILQYARPEAEIIDVGKKPYDKHIQQAEINAQIYDAAQRGQCIVRLKGGDPAIFGRVQEEVAMLQKHAIPFEIVPGITSASATAASINIGLTARDIATSVTFTTGHFKQSEPHAINIKPLLHKGTLAVYMGVKRLKDVLACIARETETTYPIAVIFNATCHNEVRYVGTTKTILSQLKTEDGPGMVLIGDIVQHVTMPKNTTVQYYLLTGSRVDTLSFAEDVYEAGHQAYIVLDEQEAWHPSQRAYWSARLEAQHFDHIVHVTEDTCLC